LDPRIRIFLEIVEEQNGDPRRLLATMRDILGLSENRLRRLFKLNVGKTVLQHKRETRMARAACLLGRQNLPIKEVGHLCGYDDISNFYRDFKKVHGMTPKQLRRREFVLVPRS
jgi:AraC-like DNA-binding protein